MTTSRPLFPMNIFLVLLVIAIILVPATRIRAAETLSPAEAARRVASGEAVLIDVREPDEWASGVAEPALLASLSDLRGKRDAWKPLLEEHRGKELIFYCRSGNRSGIAAGILKKEGFKTSNAGGFPAWQKAGLPVRQP